VGGGGRVDRSLELRAERRVERLQLGERLARFAELSHGDVGLAEILERLRILRALCERLVVRLERFAEAVLLLERVPEAVPCLRELVACLRCMAIRRLGLLPVPLGGRLYAAVVQRLRGSPGVARRSAPRGGRRRRHGDRTTTGATRS